MFVAREGIQKTTGLANSTKRRNGAARSIPCKIAIMQPSVRIIDAVQKKRV